MHTVDLARSVTCYARRFFSVAALAFFVLLAAQPAAFAGQNSAIAISDNNTHIDRGTAYSNLPFLTASGGTAPYTFSVAPSPPPPIGITINPDGSLSGMTCGPNGNFNMTVTATDAIGDFNTDSNVSLIVNLAPSGACTLTFNQTTLPGGSVNAFYSQTLTVSGANGSVTYTVTSGALPAGLTLSSSGTISGTPTTAGPFTFTVLATDSSGATGSQSFTITISAITLTLSPGSLPNGTTGTAYNQTVTASGGTGSYTFAVISGALPTGLSLSSAGAITGTPSAAGPFSFTVQATDSSANTGTKAYTVTIGSNSLTVNPASLPNGFTGTAYNQTVTASGGTGSYTFAVTSGALPTGLSLSSGGAITGTPTAGGPFSFTIQATDSSANTGSRPYTVNIGSNSLTLNPASLPNGFTGTAYNQTVTASGGTGPYTFAVTSGALPSGLSLSSAGAITGTPTAGGAFSFTVQATDGSANTGSRSYTVNIGSNSLTVNPASLPNGFTGTAYNQTVTASGGTGPYTFAVTSGALPTGLSLSSAGAISGTPSAGGPFSFTIQATDSSANTGSKSYTVNIGSNSLTVNPASLPNGFTGTAYNQTLTASGGTGPYTFAVTSGALPTGLSLSSAGAITGTPSAGGPFSFTVQASDSSANTGSRPYTVNIGSNSLTVNPASLPNGFTGTAYNQTLTASGGIGPYTFAITAGTLPTGLSLSSAGAITGTPTAGGPFSFTIQATDSSANSGSRSFTFNVGSNSLTLNPASLPNGTTGTTYNQTLTATGGTGPYIFAITAGALPTGLSLSSAGAITGMPTAAGAFSFTVQATDSSANTGSRPYTFSIGNLLTVNPASLPNGTTGTAYNQTLTATGGTAPYIFSITSGALPSGLSLSSGGIITGTPSVGGAFSFTVQTTDSSANTGSRSFSFNVGTNSLTLNPTVLANGTQGSAYSQTVSVSGGSGPVTFELSSGALPSGLSLNASTGVISGTPAGSGASSFTVQATDNAGNTGSKTFTVNIGAASLLVNPASLPAGTRGAPYSQTVSASGGTGPYSYVVSAGVLPAGLALNSSTGVISGTPGGSGSSSFSIRATDTLGNIGTRGFAVNIGTASLTVNPATLPASIAGRPYSATVAASGGVAPYVYSVLSGALPPGLTLNAVTGVISGTVTAHGLWPFTIQARDSNGNTGSRAYALASRLDPALDPEVAGLVNAQVAAARRFTSAQIDNVGRHLESLHDGFDPCSTGFGIILPRSADQRSLPYRPYSPSAAEASYPDRPPGSPAPQATPRAPRSGECDTSGYAFWVSGAVQFGTITPDGLSSGSKFTTSGVTAGVDWRAADNLIAGITVGYGTDHTDLGLRGTLSGSDSASGTAYASYKPFEFWFIDAVIGAGSLGYDNRRFVADDNVTVAGNRKGATWFGAVSTGYEARYGALRFSPYTRLDFMSAQLDGYSEQGGSAALLTYRSMAFHSVAGTLGLRGSWDIAMDWGVLTPTARAEYRHAFDGSFQQSMYYADLGPGQNSTLTQAAATRGMVNTNLGLRARSNGGISAELDYGVSGASARLQSQTVRGSLKLPF